ncbi:Zn finger protein, partial [Neophaeococcomyces mojaviensis]
MAAVYPAQTYTIPQNNHQMCFFSSNGQTSPASSTSPASPRTNGMDMPYNPNPAKQLRPPKQPLYVPAVLRQTEHFATMSPLTPPKSTRGSLENMEERNDTQFSPADLEAYFQQAHMAEEELGEVTGPPKQDHWRPDEASTS